MGAGGRFAGGGVGEGLKVGLIGLLRLLRPDHFVGERKKSAGGCVNNRWIDSLLVSCCMHVKP